MNHDDQDLLGVINYLHGYINPELTAIADQLKKDHTFLFTRKEKTQYSSYPQIPTFNRNQVRMLRDELLKLGFNSRINDRCEITFQKFEGDLNGKINELLEYGTYEESWDGFGAHPFDSKIIESSIKLLTQFYHNIPLPKISPNPNGTISFE